MPGTSERPQATYRLQLGPAFGFRDASALVPYLADLGVTCIYLSPILTARAGSPHGYDVADPASVSDALGGEKGLRALAQVARRHGLGVMVDIVPNHVGTGADNPLWEALLRDGPAGEGGTVFDVDWAAPLPGAGDKVIVPVLGAPYGRVLHAGELELVEVGERARLRYHDHSFPLSDASLDALERAGGIAAVTGTAEAAETWSRFHGLLEQQYYRLVHWRAGQGLVNYRRFFAINDLAAVRVEDPLVFDLVHRTVLRLVHDGVIDGLRVDHVDGLAHPAAYLARLREASAGVWTVVEKILAADEVLPAWEVAGTTGYDFLADVLALWVDPRAAEALSELARTFDAWPEDPAHTARDAKRDVLRNDLRADRDRVVRALWELCHSDREARDIDAEACQAVVEGAVEALDVYRTYVWPGEEAEQEDVERVRAAVACARDHDAAPSWLWDFAARALCGEGAQSAQSEAFVRRFQQLSAAVMAKGVEDTFLYRQHRLAALNEVGVDPERFGGDITAFHKRNDVRATGHPCGLLTTSTHDTKRDEDVRLRIAALSELADEWVEAVPSWRERNRRHVEDTPAGPAPCDATQYLLYQTLVGVWPSLRSGDAGVVERLVAYLRKAAREDGRRTSWTDPDVPYEAALEGFVRGLCADEGFLGALEPVAEAANEIAMVSGLGQVLLRCTAPGAPDTYQGTELWGDGLVDPDNRRPVEFERRAQALAAFAAHQPDPGSLLAERADGRVKLWVLSRALHVRRTHPTCFGPQGEYRPLLGSGRWREHVVAFARVGPDGDAAVTIVPRLSGAVMGGRAYPPTGADWEDTAVLVDPDLEGREWEDALGGPGASSGGQFALDHVLADLPVALLVSRRQR